MKAVWSEDQWIQEHQTKPETDDQPVEIVDSNKQETVTKKSKPQVRDTICTLKILIIGSLKQQYLHSGFRSLNVREGVCRRRKHPS